MLRSGAVPDPVKTPMLYQPIKFLSLACLVMASTVSMVRAQDAPIPGTASAPLPGSAPQPTRRANGSLGYGDLPLNADDAKARIVELTNLVPTARPQELQERVDQLSVWLGDMIEAHNKMANAFAKHDELKAQYNAERQSAQRFSRLKHQAQLLKADLLITMRRYPEALVPLVEIVISEPTTETGKGAYKRLQDLGFSQDVSDSLEPAPSMIVHEPPPASAVPAKSGATKRTVVAAPKRTEARR